MQSLQIENACGQDSIRTEFHNNIIKVSKFPLASIVSAFVHMNYLDNSVCPQLSNFNSHYNDKNGWCCHLQGTLVRVASGVCVAVGFP